MKPAIILLAWILVGTSPIFSQVPEWVADDVAVLTTPSQSGGLSGNAGWIAVSYTHQTLPTILLV